MLKQIIGLFWVVFISFFFIIFYFKNELYDEGKMYLKSICNGTTTQTQVEASEALHPCCLPVFHEMVSWT